MAAASKHPEREADPAGEGNGHAAPGAPGAAGAAAAAGPAKLPKPAKLKRFARNLRAVWTFARRHWVGLVAALALMSVEAVASSGRIFLFYPVMTKVLTVDPNSGDDQSTQVTSMIDKAKGKLGRLMQAYDGLIDRMNTVTGPWVSDERIDKTVAHVEDPAARARAAEDVRSRHATLISVSFLFIVFIVVMCIAAYLESYMAARVSLMIAMDVRKEVTRKLLDQPVGYFDSLKRGELVGRALGDVEGYYNWLNLLLNTVIKGGVQLIASVILLMAISGKLTLFCLLGLPFLLPMRNLMKRVLKRSHRRAQETGKRVESLLQIFSGIRTVKAFGTEPERLKDFHHTDEEVTRVSLKVQRAKSTADALIEFMNNFLALALAVGGGWLVLTGMLDVTPAQLIIFLFLVANLYQPVKKLVKAYNNMQDTAASVERTQELLNLPPPPPDPVDAVDFSGVKHAIRFENVSFAYVAGRPVVENVSFEIPRGGVVALVGPTGGGKSTLCDLLLRFYDPPEGRITVDGTDVRQFRRKSFLMKTAVVAQAPFLFHTTIRENIRQGNFTATDDDIIAAAKDAQIHDHIASLPAGYSEEVGESGVRLSGGQRQRITIARALVRDPSILVLDEATASLDAASEHAVQVALERLQAGRTTLVVAHRLATVQNATRIVVIAQGRVLDQGTHHELLARCGLYAELVKMQNLMPAVEAPHA
jgi:subfamily B ATP-binding cassette protein MsbA